MNKYRIDFNDGSKWEEIEAESYASNYIPNYSNGIHSSVAWVEATDFVNFTVKSTEGTMHGDVFYPKETFIVASFRKDIIKSIKKIA